MKKVISFCLLISASFQFISCGAGTKDDPKETAKAFYEALEAKDYDKASTLATKGSKTMLDLIKSMAEIGETMAKPEEKEKALEKAKNAVYSNAEINGDVAVVKVTVDNQTNDIKLKKEDGVWKVALDKETLKETMSQKGDFNYDDSLHSIDKALDEVRNISVDSLKSAINQAGDLLKSDTLRKVIEKAGDALEKAGEALKEASKENN